MFSPLAAAIRYPLFLDCSPGRNVDTFFSFNTSCVVEGNALVGSLVQSRKTEQELQQECSKKLTAAMLSGMTLLVSMGTSAADFKNKFTGASFPVQVFEYDRVMKDQLYKKWMDQGQQLQLENNVASGQSDGFNVVVTSTFSADEYRDFLKDSIPLDKLQPVEVLV